MEIIGCSENAQNEFVSGIQSLDCVVDVLNKAEIDESTSVVVVNEIVQSICRPIRQAHVCLTTALKLWDVENAKLCEVVERSVAELSKVNKLISEKKSKVEVLKKTLESLNEQIRNNEDELKGAKNAVSRANETLRDSEKTLADKKRDQAIVTGVGAGLMVIPVLGWIAGGTMLIVSLTALEDNVNAAKESVGSAEGNVSDCERKVQNKKTERENLGQKLSQEERDREEIEKKLKVLQTQVEERRTQQKKHIEASEKLKNTCHEMTKIWGKSRVLKNETRHAYTLEPLIAPLKEIANMFTSAEENKLKQTALLSKDIDFAGMSLKLDSICAKMPENALAILDVVDDLT